MSGVSKEEMAEIKQAFELFDVNKSGFIQTKDLINAMNSLGYDSKNQIIYSMIEELDKSQGGKCNFEQFAKVITAKVGSDKNSKEDCQKVFKMFATNDKIQATDLERACKELDEQLQQEEIQEMIKRADTQGKGYVDFDDFYNIITKKF